ncbi:NUDIX hydrolase [Roseivirga sp. BDSF3-8]|uniref:NUDIX hydrolase n=1 Tax=Roseivirga sp. BDSF3-8 TaxID=3241598 RepID=UPI003531FA69
MKIFINDVPLEILHPFDLRDEEHYDAIVDCNRHKIEEVDLLDDILLLNANYEDIGHVIDFLVAKKPRKLDSVTLAVKKQKKAIKFVKKQFNIIKAAGGLVEKDGKVLLIHRLGKWDLPKGKLEKKEKNREGAIREVEEECGIKVGIDYKICNTWHTYNRNGKRMLKKTAWFRMHCLDDSNMTPQTEEDIEKVEWVTDREARQHMYNSYRSIRYVFSRYLLLRTDPVIRKGE